ncbi:hypothetical protein Kisp01_16890 [Kineosporia sp. NBRC 101677]|uniref:AAA family ATPase n=1 Tax=Kineosporia sp. NBRC 101677 TaxID=3032197 RepID=UPI0024A2D030|nr:ATP-binding protein [Kineosporia sp. NBRC 101677]GLY14674.1 hypothetical protein Kisp01_16890 [Kineosporia sp. NBRC 101677]
MSPSAATPVVYLLSGLPGSGKSTYARGLERTGVTRLCVDELVQAQHGRPGKDYPGHEQPAREAPILAEVRRQLARLVLAGQSVVLDHGLGLRSDRDDYKKLVTESGGQWRLLYFQVERPELLRRLSLRNAQESSGIMTVETLDWMIRTSEPCEGEGEELVTVRDA